MTSRAETKDRPPILSSPITASTPGPAPAPVPLRRSNTGGSGIHTRNALRRMATHETGEFVDDEEDGGRLDTHDEHNEHEHDHDHHHDHDLKGPSRRSSGHSNCDHHGRKGISGADGEGEGEEGDEETKIEGKRNGNASGTGLGGKRQKAENELQDQTNLLPVKQVITVFAGLTCALFCSLLDQTIVTTALPTLGQVFNRADISSWVGTAYLLTSTTAQPIYGRVSDIFGRKFTLLACLFIFLMGSLACALAQTMIQLIIFRAIQGLGGGGILTLSMIIISDVVSLKERGKYQGITGVVVALANSCGPIIGGLFTEKVSWRWCFYVNLPLTVISMITIIFLLPLKRVKGSMWEKLKKLDFYGSLLTLAWATLILIALSWGGSQYAWSSAAVIAPLVIGFAILGLFIYVEAKLVLLPLVPMRIFKKTSVAACYVTTLFNGMAFYATLYYLPQYFQVVKEVSAIRSGVLTLPLMLVQTVTAFVAGTVQSKTGDYWWNLVVGFSIWTIGLGLLSSIGPTTSEAKLAVYQVITGIGAGQTFQTSLVAIQAGVDRKDMATATGLRNFVRMLGGTIALAVSNAIVNNSVRSHLTGLLSPDLLAKILVDPLQAKELGLSAAQVSSVTDAYSKGINGVFYFSTPVIGISVLITLFFVKREKLTKRADEAVKKAEAKAWIESKKAKRKNKGHAEKSSGGDSNGVSPAADDDDVDHELASEQEHDHHHGRENGDGVSKDNVSGGLDNQETRKSRLDSEVTVTDPTGDTEEKGLKEGVKEAVKKEAEDLVGPPGKE